MIHDTSFDFHPKWVAPIYMNLMNGNFLNLSSDEQAVFVGSVHEILDEIDDLTLQKMLLWHGWRPRLTAGWLVGFRKRQDFVDNVGKSLIQFPDHAAMHCFALARIGGDMAQGCLEKYLTEFLLPYHARQLSAETLSVQYGLAALRWISPVTAEAFYPKWDVYLDALFDSVSVYKGELSTMYKNRWNIKRTTDELKKWMDFAEKHFD